MCNSGNRFADRTAPMTPVTSVLIVDDEPAVRDLMSRWVASLGLRSTDRIERRRGARLSARQPLRPGRHRRDDAGPRRPLARRRDAARAPATRPSSWRRRTPNCSGGDAQHTPIADFLIKPFQRERFVLAVDRGRQWRKLALEEVHWHAMLSIELRDRTAQVVHALDQQVAAGAREDEALTSLLADRMPEVAAPRRARGALRALGRARAGRGSRCSARTRDRRALSRRRQAGDARGAHVEAVAADPGRERRSCASTSSWAPRSWSRPGRWPARRRPSARRTSGSREAATRKKSPARRFRSMSRLIAVADAYDAMTQDRAYRIRLDSSDAVAEILRCSPSQFDPRDRGRLPRGPRPPLSSPIRGTRSSHDRTLLPRPRYPLRQRNSLR